MALPEILNPKFEVPTLTETFAYNPSGSSWVWPATKAGIEGRASRGLTDGQYGFIEDNAYVEQSIACDGTPFQIQLAAKWRLGTVDQALRISLDGVTVADFAITTTWTVYTTPTITPAPGTRVLKISNPVASAQVGFDTITVLAVAPTTTPGRLLCFTPGAVGLMG